MIIRALDSTGDWQFGKGIQDYKKDLDALKQNILTRVKEWKNDCFFNPSAGPDWNNYLDIGTKTSLDRDILRVIQQSFGVLRIDSYTSDISDRDLSFTCQVATIYGNVLINEGS